jgi:hypothetical protein
MSVHNCKRRILSSSVNRLTHRRLRRIRHTVGCGMSSSRLAQLVDLRGMRWNASLSSEGPGRRARFAIHRHPSRWICSYHCIMLFFTGESFQNLVRKRRFTVTIDCVRANSSTQNAFSARVAIFTQPAPLAATDVIKHLLQINLDSFSFYRYFACYHPLRHSNVPIFCNVSGNYE